MLWRTPTAVHILLRPGVHFKPIKCNALLTDWNFRQTSPNFPIKSVLIHSQVAGSIAETDQAGLDLHRLSPNVDRSNLFPDMAQLFADSQAGLLIPSSLSLAEFSLGRPASMG